VDHRLGNAVLPPVRDVMEAHRRPPIDAFGLGVFDAPRTVAVIKRRSRCQTLQ
jgi:hypothetical protein